MHSYEDIRSRSLSEDELIVEYMDAMELLHIFEEKSEKVCGWEGRLLYVDGSIELSRKYAQKSILSSLPLKSAIALAKSAIMQAHTEWQEKPEVLNAELYFCISTTS